MNRRALFLILFLLLSLGVTFAVGEWWVRSQGYWDSDGSFFFRERPIRPYALPVERARKGIDRYLRDSSGAIVYDPDLGWSHRPRACTSDGRDCMNSFGLRADREYTTAMRPGAFRVSMFGDSFIAGAEVDLAHSPAVQVEGMLKARDIDAEVLNFGVGGFGFDQAYLHYKRDSSHFDTTVIVQGLQLENIGRDVTLFRIIAFPGTVIPFSKPRYILRDGKLALINQPTIAPEDVPGTLANFPRWPLVKYESFHAAKYRHRWYTPSRLLSTIVDLWDDRRNAKHDQPDDIYAVNGEAMNITVPLLERYRAEVTATGKPFVLIYLPRQDTIDAILAGERDPWQAHLDRLEGFTIADPRPRFVAYAREHGVASLYHGHYTPAGYRLVAEALAEVLLPLAKH